MTKLILTAIVVVAGGIFWVWKRYGSESAVIARKKERLQEIEKEQQDATENGEMLLFDSLDSERLQLCEEIRRLKN